MSEVMTVNQTVQVGVESVHGTAPAGGANKLLTSMMIGLDPHIEGDAYAAAGHRADSVWVPSYDYSDLSVDGPMSYDEMAYALAMHYGAPTITTPGGATNARKLAFNPPLSGIIDPTSLYVQKGDAVRAADAKYAILADFGFEATRKSCVLSGCKGFAQALTDGISLTASPTAVGVNPVRPVHWNVYLDTTAAGIGGTKLTRCYKVAFKSTGAHAANWPGDRANASYATTVNKKPGMELTLSLMADAAAGALYADTRAGTKLYIRFEAIGAEIEAGQNYTFVMDWAAVPVPGQRQDDDGAWVQDWTFMIVEDDAWTEASASGTFLSAYLINTLTAL